MGSGQMGSGQMGPWTMGPRQMGLTPFFWKMFLKKIFSPLVPKSLGAYMFRCIKVLAHNGWHINVRA